MPTLALVVALLASLAPLESAQGLLDEKRPSDALELLEEAVVAGGLAEDELLSAYALMGRAYGMLGRGQQAQRAFSVCLRMDAAFRLGAVGDPEVRGPFEAALASLPGEDEALLARVSVETREGRRGLAATLVADDLDLVAGARVLLAGAPLGTLGLSRGEPTVFYPLDPAAVRGPIEVQLVDAYGNALRRIPVEGTVEGESADRSHELRWLALSGGTLLGLGAVGVTVAGVWFAAVDGGNLDAPSGAREVGLASVGMATGVIALGGVLVVLDSVLSSFE